MAGRVSSPRFVGRQAELAALSDAVAQLGTGARVAVFVGGEAGAGKSRLLGEMAAVAATGGARVVTGACVALAADSLPYAPFSQALGELVGELGVAGVEELVGAAARADLARLVPELRQPGDEAQAAGARRTARSCFTRCCASSRASPTAVRSCSSSRICTGPMPQAGNCSGSSSAACAGRCSSWPPTAATSCIAAIRCGRCWPRPHVTSASCASSSGTLRAC